MRETRNTIALTAVIIAAAGFLGLGQRDIRADLRAATDDRSAIRAEVADVRAEVADVRAEVADVRAELADLRADFRALAQRVARIEGALPFLAEQPGAGDASR